LAGIGDERDGSAGIIAGCVKGEISAECGGAGNGEPHL
jgi:hypothetical protein